MIDPLQLIFQKTGIKNSYFSPTSRYYGLATKTLATNIHKAKVFVKRRFIAQSENFQVVQEHSVNQGERLDNITHEYLGDAEQFWRICDANAAMHPNELTEEIGKKLKITMPEGVSENKS